MNAKNRLSALLVTLTALSSGCHHDKPSTSFEGYGIKGHVAVVENDKVIVDLPLVKVTRDTTFISGTVHRKSGVTGDLRGRVDIEFLDAEGQYVDGMPALLNPRSLPRDPSTKATFSTSYGYVPPAGSTIRVHFVDHETEVTEDMEGTGFAYDASGHGGSGQGASGAADQGGHGAVPSHTSNGQGNGQGGFGSNIGGGHW